jgi:hypothetical protein
MDVAKALYTAASTSLPTRKLKKRAASRGKYPSKPRYWNSDIQKLEADAKSARQEYACAAFYDPDKQHRHTADTEAVIDENNALLHNAIKSASTAEDGHRGGGSFLKRGWDQTMAPLKKNRSQNASLPTDMRSKGGAKAASVAGGRKRSGMESPRRRPREIQRRRPDI